MKPGALGKQRTPGRCCLSKALPAQQPHSGGPAVSCGGWLPALILPYCGQRQEQVQAGPRHVPRGNCDRVCMHGGARVASCAFPAFPGSRASSSLGPGPQGHLNSRLPVQGQRISYPPGHSPPWCSCRGTVWERGKETMAASGLWPAQSPPGGRSAHSPDPFTASKILI